MPVKRGLPAAAACCARVPSSGPAGRSRRGRSRILPARARTPFRLVGVPGQVRNDVVVGHPPGGSPSGVSAPSRRAFARVRLGAAPPPPPERFDVILGEANVAIHVESQGRHTGLGGHRDGTDRLWPRPRPRPRQRFAVSRRCRHRPRPPTRRSRGAVPKESWPRSRATRWTTLPAAGRRAGRSGARQAARSVRWRRATTSCTRSTGTGRPARLTTRRGPDSGGACTRCPDTSEPGGPASRRPDAEVPGRR